MVVPALAIFSFGLAIWLRGGIRFRAETSSASRPPLTGKALREATGAVLGLRYLQGGGPGCTYPGEVPSAWRRIYHSFVFWGFLSDFVSTTVAFIYQDFLHELPPYRLLSAPVIFGTVGGVLLALGTAGLTRFKWKSDRVPAEPRTYAIDYTFLITLGLTALTGLLTLAFRATPALGSLLVLHLASVAALFMTAPYGKFVHALYRSLALLRYYAERNQPSNQ
jgi:citrate/tricarballylate utilization protein